MGAAAGVVELVDTPALGAGAARCGGSSPSARISPGCAPDCQGPRGVPTIAGMLRCLITALTALLLVPAVASAESESVTSGATTATLSWTGAADAVTGATLTITRGGVVAFDRAIG